MTGSDPLVRVQLDHGEVLGSPPDWPQLPPPAPGEPLAAYTERAVLGDPFYQEVEKRCVRAGFSPGVLGALRPATHTLEWWQSNHPNRSFALPWAVAFPDEWRQELRQLRELVYWRLIVELFERLRSGEFRAEGRRIDVVGGGSKVVAELWSNPNMLLLPRSEFWPRQRHGHPPLGPGLPSVIELRLWPPQPISQSPRRGGGKPPKYDWHHVANKLREKLSDEGIPRAGDGGQAELERFVAGLFSPDSCPAESTIRAKVSEAIENYRRELG